MTGDSSRALAAGAVSRALRSPGLLGMLVGFHLISVMVSWLWSLSELGVPLQGRPAPDLFTWAVLVQQEPALLRRLLTAGACVLGLHLVLGALAASVMLCRFSGRPLRAAVGGPWLRLLALRVVALVASAALGAGAWFSLVPLSRTLHAADNELEIMVLHLLAALPFVLVLALVHCVAHYAQVLLVVRGVGTLAAPGAALRLLTDRPRPAMLLWATGWLAWGAVTAAAALPGLDYVAVAMVAALLRLMIHLWMWAAGYEVAGA